MFSCFGGVSTHRILLLPLFSLRLLFQSPRSTSPFYFRMDSKHTLRFYKEAAKILRTYKEFGVSIKSQVYNLKHYSKKAVYALVIETYKHEDVIESLLKACPIEFEQVKKKYLKKKNDALLRIMVTELLWGKKDLLPDSKLVSVLMANHEKLLNELSKEKNQKLVGGLKDKFPDKVTIPRYVRINTLYWTIEEAIEYFNYNGCEQVRTEENYDAFLDTVKHLSESQYVQDLHLKEVFIFHPKTEFFNDEKYLDGSLILQDKASCMAGYFLNPEPDSTVLDMCAAPGMKTTHLAAIMGNKGCIYAVDRDKKRFESLNELVKRYGATNVKTINADALTLTSEQYSDVRYILLDPSCTGGGMVRRKVNDCTATGENETRLRKLANFQAQLLRHALQDYPSVEKVLYSTCSIETKENEEVVHDALSNAKDFKLVDLRTKFPDWKNLGSEEYKYGKKCIYFRPEDDLCNGFFVALFKRRSKECDTDNGDSNQFFEDNVNSYNDETAVSDFSSEKKRKKKKKRE